MRMAIVGATRSATSRARFLSNFHVGIARPSARRSGAGMAPVGRGCVRSHGGAVGRKDSVTGHWGWPGSCSLARFRRFRTGSLPRLIDGFETRIGRRTLGNRRRSGTVIIDELGPEHMRTGFPIVYTSADSVFQIAAHEEVIPVHGALSLSARSPTSWWAKGMGIGRVIARPFVGAPGTFTRTANRHDYALPPSERTLLDALTVAGHPVLAIGKIQDLFAGRGVTAAVHTRERRSWRGRDRAGDVDLPAGLIFANLVDFDTLVRPSQRSGRLRCKPRAIRRPSRDLVADAASATIS